MAAISSMPLHRDKQTLQSRDKQTAQKCGITKRCGGKERGILSQHNHSGKLQVVSEKSDSLLSGNP